MVEVNRMTWEAWQREEPGLVPFFQQAPTQQLQSERYIHIQKAFFEEKELPYPVFHPSWFVRLFYASRLFVAGGTR